MHRSASDFHSLKSPGTAWTRQSLSARPGDWAALYAAAYSAWHSLTHAQAGRQRVALAQLCLSTAWRTATAQESKAQLQRLADFLAASGAKVDVLFVASDVPAELRLRWVAWHAPPLASYLPPMSEPLDPVSPTPSLTTPGAFKMKLPNFFAKSLAADTPAQSQPEPQLAPHPVAPARRSGTQLTLALSQMAEHIARQEVHDLLELGMKGRYRLFTLSFWVSAANQPALRNLMEINQRDPSVARQVVQAAFAKSGSASLLDTSRLALVFTPADNLPRDAAEVLIVSGRDTVALPYNYSGEIELPKISDPGISEAVHPLGVSVQAAGQAAAPAPLCLWLQTAQQPIAQRWLITQTSTVGAQADSGIQVDWSRVSGRHLVLAPDAQGGWTVCDHSSNGTLCLDAEHPAGPGNPPETPLVKNQTRPLPRAGSLRLGGGSGDPLLHFAQLGALPVAVTTPAPSPRASRRVTELGPVIGDRYAISGLDPLATKV